MQFYNDAQRRIQVKKIKASDFSLKVIESALELAFVVEMFRRQVLLKMI